MLVIDGSFGEGGGQILRTSLSLALVSGQAFTIENIRVRRAKPGLQPQHLAAVTAAVTISQAEVQGATVGSQRLEFRPGEVTGGEYAFAVGTAGSATLVLQTILPALVIAAKPSALVVEGGTHNPLAPPFEFIAKTYLPLLQRMGPRVKLKLDRHGFYPAGGGKMRATIEPAPNLSRIELLDRGRVCACRCTAVVANLPRHIAERELKVLKRELALAPEALYLDEVKSRGPGNVVIVEVESANLTEVFTAFGELGVRAEVVAGRIAKEVRRYLEGGVPVGEYLADQLMLPMAMTGSGAFVTFPLSRHAETQIEVLRRFLPVDVRTDPVSDQAVRVEVSRLS